MVYLDNAATTKPIFTKKYTSKSWFNSNVSYATDAKTYLVHSKSKIMKELGVNHGKLLFFRTSTDCINFLAEHLCIIPLETAHDSVWEKRKVKYGKYLLCYTYVNNMTGMFEMPNIGDLATKEHFVGIDLTSCIGKAKIPVDLNCCDAAWFSGHKFHCEKGIACLWIGESLAKYLGANESDENQYGLVHGTLDVDGIVALEDALIFANSKWFDVEQNSCGAIHYIVDTLNEKNIKCELVSPYKDIKAHAINTIVFEKINGDALQKFLSEIGVYVGVGHSSCAEDGDYRVLKTYHVKNPQNSIRVSFSYTNNFDEDPLLLVRGIERFCNLFLKD